MSHVHNTDNSSKVSDFRAPLPPPSALSTASLIKSIRSSSFAPDNTALPATPPSTNGSQAPRKSKFSDLPPAPVPPPAVLPIQSTKLGPVAAAAAAAARINANLKAKGKLSDQTLTKPMVNSSINSPLSLIKISETKKVFSNYISKIDINDLPSASRTYFTQVSVQESLNKDTGAAISTKGQYLTPEEKKHLEGIDKQLHLFIQSPSKEKTDLAVTKIKELISKQKLPGPVPGMSNSMVLPPIKPIPIGQPALPTGNFMQEKVFVGMDYCDPEFDLKSKLIGVNYANFNFVANATGAKVILRGKGSGFIEPTSGREAFESMYVFISHPNQPGVDAAKKLVYNLISTVHSEYKSFKAKKSGNQSSTLKAPTISQYPPPLPAPINPYGGAAIPPPTAYAPMPYAPPSASANPSYPTPVANNFYPAPSAPINPYGSPAPAPPVYSIPPPNVVDVPPVPPPNSSNKESKPPVSNTNEIKAKKRRFQEEQPDDSNLLGYKQYSASKVESDDSKRSRKKDKLLNTANNNIVEEEKSSNLPFWMSHK